MPRIAGIEPLRGHWCNQNGPMCNGCSRCTKGVSLSAKLEDYRFDAVREANGALHRVGCPSATPSATRVRARVRAVMADLQGRHGLRCRCLPEPEPAEAFTAQHRPLQQALGGIMRCALSMSQPTANQLTRWRNALVRATHPAWGDLPTRAAAVLDVVTGDDTTVTPLPPGQLRWYAATCIAQYPGTLDFGDAVEWWPRGQLEDARKAYLGSLDAALVHSGGIGRAEFHDAMQAAAKKLAGSALGRPHEARNSMLRAWNNTVRDAADPTPNTVLRLKVRRDDVDGILEPLLVAYQAAASTDENGWLTAVLVVPEAVRRYLMTTARWRPIVTDLGEAHGNDSSEVADLALGLMAEMPGPDALDAARSLTS